jgi:steroid 5-alpha reductase family enzyme
VGVGLWFIGWIGEAVADSQLKRFRKRQNSESENSVCQTGLWRYSRHPNYFFEWLIWVGFAFLALSAPGGWMGLLAPLLMWHFLVNVTGIPMTETLSVKSKGEAYRRYQYTTNAFFPGPTKTLNVRSD